MHHTKFEMAPLAGILPAKNNPRREFTGEAFDQLVDSIREKGVLEPVLLRPIEPAEAPEGAPNAGRLCTLQLVAGERRFRAAHQVACENGGPESATIPKRPVKARPMDGSS